MTLSTFLTVLGAGIFLTSLPAQAMTVAKAEACVLNQEMQSCLMKSDRSGMDELAMIEALRPTLDRLNSKKPAERSEAEQGDLEILNVILVSLLSPQDVSSTESSKPASSFSHSFSIRGKEVEVRMALSKKALTQLKNGDLTCVEGQDCGLLPEALGLEFRALDGRSAPLAWAPQKGEKAIDASPDQRLILVRSEIGKGKSKKTLFSLRNLQSTQEPQIFEAREARMTLDGALAIVVDKKGRAGVHMIRAGLLAPAIKYLNQHFEEEGLEVHYSPGMKLLCVESQEDRECVSLPGV